MDPKPQDQFCDKRFPACVPPVETANVPVDPMNMATVVCERKKKKTEIGVRFLFSAKMAKVILTYSKPFRKRLLHMMPDFNPSIQKFFLWLLFHRLLLLISWHISL